jgi:hypothetical protein
VPPRNFIPTVNPFGLATPPDWFLVCLGEYDSELVVFPSVAEPVYRLARRAKQSTGMLRVLKNFPDTKIFVDNRLYPVKSILSPNLGMAWGRVLSELPDYDQWRVSADPMRVAAQLDAIEQKRDAAIQRDQESECDARSGVARRIAQYATGSRVGQSYSKGAGGSGARTGLRPARRPLGGGPALFVGR